MPNHDNEPFSTRLSQKDRDRLWSKIAQASPDQCWLWTGARQSSGHGIIKLFGKKGSAYRAHRMVYILTHGDIDTSVVVRHTCDTPACCNPAHLIAGSHADNVADRVARRRSAAGEHHGRSKLTWDTVAVIRQQLAAGKTPYSLAKTYKVDPTAIRQIRDNITWRRSDGSSQAEEAQVVPGRLPDVQAAQAPARQG